MTIDLESPRVMALNRYSGFVYRVKPFRETIRQLLTKGVHCLIASGAFGVLHPYEPIPWYNAHISQTKTVWRNRLGAILMNYISRQHITRMFIACSQDYARVLRSHSDLWRTNGTKVYWFVAHARGRGGAPADVGKQIAEAIILLEQGQAISPLWKAEPDLS